MKRNSYFLIILVFFTLLFWVELQALLKGKHEELRALIDEQSDLNEQLISAQILASKLDRVYTLFERNLALSQRDSLAEDASMPFMNDITKMLDDLGIKLISIKPEQRIENISHIRSPYRIIIEGTFEQLGQFITEVERSPRLVSIEKFTIKNGLEKIKGNIKEEELDTQVVEIDLATLTLVKKRNRGYDE